MDSVGYPSIYLFAWALTLSLLFRILRRIERPSVSPASIWALAWATLFWLSLFFGNRYRYTSAGLLLMMVNAAAFPAGALLGFRLFKSAASGAFAVSRNVKAISRIVPWVELMAVVSGVFGAIYYSASLGHSVLEIRSFAELAVAATANAAAIYSGDSDLPPLANFGYSALQIGVIFNAFMFAIEGRNWRRIVACTALFLVCVLWTSVATTRTYIGVAVVWWAASFIAGSIYLHRELMLSWRPLILGGLSISGLCILFIAYQSVRLGDTDLSGFRMAAEHMRPWAGGTIPAFCSWLSKSTFFDTTYGTYLLRPISKLFGMKTIDYVDLLPIGGGETSNATTLIRIFVQDFGIWLSPLATFIFGGLSIYAYRRCQSGSLLGWAMLVCVLCGVIWSPNAWFFLYGSRIFTLILLGLLTMALALFASTRALRPPSATALPVSRSE